MKDQDFAGLYSCLLALQTFVQPIRAFFADDVDSSLSRKKTPQDPRHFFISLVSESISTSRLFFLQISTIPQVASETTIREEFPQVIRKIPKPTHPIRVFTGPPPLFSIEAQCTVMRWTHERGYLLSDPGWLRGPSTTGIKDVVWPYVKHLGHEDDENIAIEFLADGGFNRVYTIQAGAKSNVF